MWKKTAARFLISIQVFSVFLLLVSCRNGATDFFQEPEHTGVFTLNDSTQLFCRMEIEGTGDTLRISFVNNTEKITAEDLKFSGDSLTFRMPVFDAAFYLKFTAGSFRGIWKNYARKTQNEIPFEIRSSDFVSQAGLSNENSSAFSGRWAVKFNPNTTDEYPAVGIFSPAENPGEMAGTFLTETGDYRFLAGGIQKNGNLYLSCFDGAHAFVFKAQKVNDSLQGHFYSGSHSYENFLGIPSQNATLGNPDSLTYLLPGSQALNFSFPDDKGKTVSLSDDSFSGKVVIIQIMGTWCPNCLDETEYLSHLYKNKREKGLEIISLAFEKSEDQETARKNIQRLRKKTGAEYPILITGITGKQGASKVFPQVNRIMAFPTTLFIDRKGKVRKIHTGFLGPGTGAEYESFVEETGGFVDSLLRE